MKRILVIDDDEKIVELIKRWLEKGGYEIMTAANGAIGLEMQREAPADLIITDIFMPEKEGTQLLMEVREEFPDTKVIVMSGGGGSPHIDYLELSSLLGAVKVFQKPFEMKDLLETVNSLFESS